MISVRNIDKEFNDQKVLRSVNLDIHDGEILVIVGASGSGKTVLLQHLIGLLKPDRGSILFDGTDIARLPEKKLLPLRKNIGYLFQEGALYDFMTVYDNVAFPLQEHSSLSESAINQKVKDVLRLVGLQAAEEKFPSQLSGGMKKRAALARAIIADAKVLFCDEPTSGLDPLRSRDIWNLIRDITRTLHCTTIITSHDIDNAMRIADRLALIHEGRMIVVASPQEIQESKDPLVRQFFSE